MPAAKYNINQPPKIEETSTPEGQKELRMTFTLLIREPWAQEHIKKILKSFKNQQHLGDFFVRFLAKHSTDMLSNGQDYLDQKINDLSTLIIQKMTDAIKQIEDSISEKMLNNASWLEGKNTNIEE